MNLKSIFILLSMFYYGNMSYANSYRILLDSALKSEKHTDKLIATLKNKTGHEASGYLGVAYVMKSNHCSFPFTKLNYFHKGIDLLDKSINALTNNIEFIFYRYTIQKKIPKILNYNHMKEDHKRLKEYILQPYNKLKDPELYFQIFKLTST